MTTGSNCATDQLRLRSVQYTCDLPQSFFIAATVFSSGNTVYFWNQSNGKFWFLTQSPIVKVAQDWISMKEIWAQRKFQVQVGRSASRIMFKAGFLTGTQVHSLLSSSSAYPSPTSIFTFAGSLSTSASDLIWTPWSLSNKLQVWLWWVEEQWRRCCKPIIAY